MKIFILFSTIFIISNISIASEKPEISPLSQNKIFSTAMNEFIGPAELIQGLLDSDIIIIGENHDNEAHHRNQLDLMTLISNTRAISIGLEFVSWVYQNDFDRYQSGELEEDSFLEIAQWGGGIPFSFYSPLIETAASSGGHAYGINAPSWLTRKIAMKGLESLTDEEKEFLPPDFEIGSDLYYDRFKEAMSDTGHQMPENSIKNFFTAHSTWDDSMAFHTIENLQNDSLPFFIIVGNFHVKYELGLPARLEIRTSGMKKITTVVQVDSSEMNDSEIIELTGPHPDYGTMGDYILFTR